VVYVWLGCLALWLVGCSNAPAPISDDLSQLEPERSATSALTVALTAFLPFNVGSPTRDLNLEQIALIDQYKPQQRRKLWVLRMPSAYIMQRPCDFGRKNWIGDGDYMWVSQIYGLGFVIAGGHAVPQTRASDQEQQQGIPVFVQLTNRVVDPEQWYRTNAKRD
jgi:hypothetical protein